MIDAIVSDPEGVMLITKFIKGTSSIPQPSPYRCPDHNQGIDITIESSDSDTKEGGIIARLRGCCRKAVDEKLEQINRTMAWVEHLKDRTKSAE